MATNEKYKEFFRALKFLVISISAGVIQIGSFTLFNEVLNPQPYNSKREMQYSNIITKSVIATGLADFDNPLNPFLIFYSSDGPYLLTKCLPINVTGIHIAETISPQAERYGYKSCDPLKVFMKK